MFIGREKEAAQLLRDLSGCGNAILVYGKRRVGKTTLIKYVLERQKKRFLYYECVKGTLQDNIDGFTAELRRTGLLTFPASFPTFQDVFAFLKSLEESVIVVIDECPYLKSMENAAFVDSAFQSIIDNSLGRCDLILSGSHIGVMKEMLEEGNALYGRFSSVISLKELSYLTASLFYPGLSPYDKIAFHSVFGGSPFILEQLQEKESLRENIVRTILREHSPVFLYASNLLLSDYSNALNAERIFSALGNGKKRYSELEDKLGGKKNGNLAKQLGQLMALDIIRRSTPINKPNDAKKAGYEINDNLLRFFFTYVHRNRSALKMLGANAFYDAYVEPTLIEFISHRFEEICRDFFSLQAQAGRLPGVQNIGAYYYDDPVAKRNGEFDVALERHGSFELYEAKYYKAPLPLTEIHKELGQIRAIRKFPVSTIGFIAANGFAATEPGYVYYTADDLYQME